MRPSRTDTAVLIFDFFMLVKLQITVHSRAIVSTDIVLVLQLYISFDHYNDSFFSLRADPPPFTAASIQPSLSTAQFRPKPQLAELEELDLLQIVIKAKIMSAGQ